MEEKRKIAVLGGGNGAHTMAADLALKGFEVRICEAPEFEATFHTTLDQQGIKHIDAWGRERFVPAWSRQVSWHVSSASLLRSSTR